MAIPQGYSPLAKIGIVDKGTYVQGTAYSQLDAVYYDGSTYLALIDSPVGIPTNDGVNWRYLARGMYAQTIENYNDLMVNEVGGYLPDALAVKEGFNSINGSLIHVKSITNDDLNNYTDNAILLFGTGAVNTIANRPANEACVVHVRKYLGWVQQYAISNNTGKVFVRTAYDDGTGNIIWTSWGELASKSDLNQLRNHVALMGTLKIVNVEARTTTANVEETIATITLPKGVWMISGYVWTDGLANFTLAISSVATMMGLAGMKASNISGIYVNSTDTEVSLPVRYCSWGTNENILAGTFKAVRIRKDEIVL